MTMLGLDSVRWRVSCGIRACGIWAIAACGSSDAPDDGADETGAAATAVPETSDGSGTEGAPAGLGGVCEGALSDSFVAWQVARDEAGGSYTFTIADEIVLADYCTSETYLSCATVTTLEVVSGQVVARSFTATPGEDTPAEDCPGAYEETSTDLGTHEDGYAVATIDDVYQTCCDLVQMQGEYHTDYGDDYEPDDVVVTMGPDTFLQRCTAQYCDDCGCSGGPTFSIGSITLGE